MLDPAVGLGLSVPHYGEDNYGVWILVVWFWGLYGQYMVDRNLMQIQPMHLISTRAQEGRTKCIEQMQKPQDKMALRVWLPALFYMVGEATQSKTPSNAGNTYQCWTQGGGSHPEE